MKEMEDLRARASSAPPLAEVLEHASDGIFVISHQGRITMWNPGMQRITGFGEAEALGATLETLLGTHLRGGFLWPAVVPTEAVAASRDIPVIRKDGSQRWLRYAASPIPGGDDTIAGHVVVARDVTLELEAEQLRADLVATVAHELRTPLTPLKGLLLSLVRGTVDDGPESRQEYYGIMLTQAERLERLIDDLLELARIESGTSIADSRSMDLGEVVAGQVAGYSRQDPARSIELLPPAEPIRVYADPFRVEQIVSNLLSNAIKYSPADAVVHVGMVARREDAVVSIRDHGEGIAEDELDRIFERFHRLQTRLTRTRVGAGLGLYIAKQLVQAMSGRIWVVSKPGEGSTFSFTLPLASTVWTARTPLDEQDSLPPLPGTVEPSS
jgi:PAS domain S-box-containing protein